MIGTWSAENCHITSSWPLAYTKPDSSCAGAPAAVAHANPPFSLPNQSVHVASKACDGPLAHTYCALPFATYVLSPDSPST